MIYLNPQVVNRWYENVFKDRVRKFPVDFSYPSTISTLINITIPNGFEIKDNINDTTLIFGRYLIRFTRQVMVKGNHLKIKLNFIRNVVIVNPQDYSVLKRYYERIIAVEAEQIVLARIKKAEPSGTSMQPASHNSSTNSKTAFSKKKGKK
jgi:hypothetical protein